MDGYKFIGLYRPKLKKANRASGGIGILISNSIYEAFTVTKCYELKDNVLGIKLIGSEDNETIIIFCVYLPPDGSRFSNENEHVLNHLAMEIYSHHEADTVLISGDSNARIGDKPDVLSWNGISPRTVIDKTANQQGERLLTFINDIKGCVINGRVSPEYDNFTSIAPHKGSAVVDYFITRQCDLGSIQQIKVTPSLEMIHTLNCQGLLGEKCSVPDHSLISLLIETSTVVKEQLHGNTLGSRCLNWRRVNRKIGAQYMNSDTAMRLLPMLIENLENQSGNQDSLNGCYNMLTEFLLQEADSVPKKAGLRPKTKFKQYWTKTLSVLWQTMKETERIYLCSKKNNDQSTRKKWQEFKTSQKVFDKELKREKRKFCREEVLNIETCCTSDPDAFWRYIRNLGPVKKGTIPWEVTLLDGTVSRDKNVVLNKWKCDFEKLYSAKNQNFNDAFKETMLNEELPRHPATEVAQNILNEPITLEEVEKAVWKGKLKMAVGLDGIPNEILKHYEVVKLLHTLFNVCFELNMIPDMWRKAIIHPIPKGDGYSTDPLKYRGLALQSCIFKIFCDILNSRVVKYNDYSENIEDEQNGFRRKRGCQHHVYSLITMIKNCCKSSRKGLFACFVDFRKAFDYVDRSLLLNRLKRQGIVGKTLKISEQIYTDTGNLIRINDEYSDELTSENGVLQGNNISPTYFSIYINDLLVKLKDSGVGITISHNRKVSVLAYADDIVLLSPTEDGLQKLINIMHKWCNNWRVEINHSKTKIVHFRRRQTPVTDSEFKLQEKLERVSEYRYLGVTLNEFMDTQKITEHLAGAASRALGAVIGCTRSVQDLGYASFTKLYHSCVTPILDYATGAWCCGYNLTKVDAVQNRAIRFYCGVPKTSPLHSIQGDMGWIPSIVRRDLETLRLYNQIVSMSDSRLTRVIMEWDIISHGEWTRNIERLMGSIESVHCFEAREPIDIAAAQEHLLKQYQDNWKRELTKKPKLRTYCKIKDEYKTESYLCANLPKYKRALISQIRGGSLPLALEYGRYAKLPVEEWICELCRSDVETETHFLFKCRSYECERQKLENKIPELRACENDDERFKLLTDMPYTFANYLAKLWNIRKDKFPTE